MKEQIYRELNLANYPDIALGSIHEYTDWPDRLILSEDKNTNRNISTTLTEYDKRKWSTVLDLVNGSILEAHDSVTDFLFSLNSEFVSKTNANVSTLISYDNCKIKDVLSFENREKCEIALKLMILKQFIGSSETLVELGSGYGKNIFYMLDKLPSFRKGICGDLSPRGIEVSKIIADAFGFDVQCYRHDHYDPNNDLMASCNNSLVFTSQAIEQLPITPENLLNQLIKSTPSLVVHFEPIYEHKFIQQDVLNILRIKYTKLCDYNRDLETILIRYQSRGQIEIVMNEPNIFGNNIFNPLSVIAWRPTPR